VGAQGTSCDEKELQIFLTHFTLPEKEKILPRSKKKKVIILSGPTAVGKTSLSLTIAKAIGGEIISADSMQVYRGMDIGTAKVSLEERRQIPHHLIDSRDLDESFNVVEFYQEACQAIKEVFSKGGVPIIVGGTGFYIHSLIYGPPNGPPSVPSLRNDLERQMEEKGADALYEQLKAADPTYAATITPRDRHKIIRALEIMAITHQQVSGLPSPSTENIDLYDFRCWFVYMPREILYPRIEQRCDLMIADGFIEEVLRLEKEGLSKNPVACQAIGYRQALEYLNSEKTPADWERFVTEFKQASRRYAKRQFTWFRREPLFRWLNLEKTGGETAAEMIIQDYELSF
jgi:tRNA dimethylallyltransferase